MIFDDQGIIGFDVSFYQDNNYTPQQIDFVKMRNYGASFVVIKVGQKTYLDPDFGYNWSKAKEACIPRSAYWFCDDSLSGPEQARLFWEAVKNDPAEGMYFADFEGGSWTHWTQLYNFLAEFKTLSGLPSERIGIYTGHPYWVEFGPRTLAQKIWFSQFPLWIAWYTWNPDYVKIPDTWTECLLWQEGTPPIGYEVGVESREIDKNRFNGGIEKFKQYLGTPPIIVPPDGENMIFYYADLKANFTSNVRSGAGTNYSISRVLTGPQTVSLLSEKITSGGYDWYKIGENEYIALTTSYENFRPAGTTPTEPKPVITVTLEAEGYPTVSYQWTPLE